MSTPVALCRGDDPGHDALDPGDVQLDAVLVDVPEAVDALDLGGEAVPGDVTVAVDLDGHDRVGVDATPSGRPGVSRARIRPWSMIATRSQSWSASSM